MCGAIKSAPLSVAPAADGIDYGLKRILMPYEIENPEVQEDSPNELKTYVLRRFVEEGDADWRQGLDVVVAFTLQEAIGLAEAYYPGAQKLGKYKSYHIIRHIAPHFAYGRAFEGSVIHW